MWQHRIFVISGLLAAVILSFTAIRSAIGLSTSKKPSPLGHFEIPTFAALIECDAHFSHQILRINNGMPAQYDTADLPLMHRNYRRLHRLMRQVGRRDGIASADQTARLRDRVRALNLETDSIAAAARNSKCSAMANMPIASKRFSQRIVGR